MNDDKLMRTGTKPKKANQELNRNIHVTHGLVFAFPNVIIMHANDSLALSMSLIDN